MKAISYLKYVNFGVDLTYIINLKFAPSCNERFSNECWRIISKNNRLSKECEFRKFRKLFFKRGWRKNPKKMVEMNVISMSRKKIVFQKSVTMKNISYLPYFNLGSVLLTWYLIHRRVVVWEVFKWMYVNYSREKKVGKDCVIEG